MKKPRVAFICVHNSCRSQIAEALSRHFAGDVFEAYSAGTHLASKINPDAVRIIAQLYGIDMTLTQKPKRLEDLPPIDVVVTMGCNVECPYLPCSFREDWGLDDPSGKGDEAMLKTAQIIEAKVMELKTRFQKGAFSKEKGITVFNLVDN